MNVDADAWSGEGTFTATLVEALKGCDAIATLRVQDAPSTRSDADYNFISNEVFVRFRTRPQTERGRWMAIVPIRRTVAVPVMTLAELEELLAATDAVGAPDYGDEGMLQFLKSERIIPPYQTRGYKLVELVRVYAAQS